MKKPANSGRNGNEVYAEDQPKDAVVWVDSRGIDLEFSEEHSERDVLNFKKETIKPVNTIKEAEKVDWSLLDDIIDQVIKDINSEGFSDHPFNFDCVNTVYFEKQVEGYTHNLTELELSRYKNLKKTNMI